jgi:hypothetical protein
MTGNPAPAAKMKLELFDLWHYFRLGAYGGSDAVERNDLSDVPAVLYLLSQDRL